MQLAFLKWPWLLLYLIHAIPHHQIQTGSTSLDLKLVEWSRSHYFSRKRQHILILMCQSYLSTQLATSNCFPRVSSMQPVLGRLVFPRAADLRWISLVPFKCGDISYVSKKKKKILAQQFTKVQRNSIFILVVVIMKQISATFPLKSTEWHDLTYSIIQRKGFCSIPSPSSSGKSVSPSNERESIVCRLLVKVNKITPEFSLSSVEKLSLSPTSVRVLFTVFQCG